MDPRQNAALAALPLQVAMSQLEMLRRLMLAGGQCSQELALIALRAQSEMFRACCTTAGCTLSESAHVLD